MGADGFHRGQDAVHPGHLPWRVRSEKALHVDAKVQAIATERAVDQTFLRHHAELVGIVVDKLDDTVEYNQPFLPLPPLIRLHDSKLSILGVALLDSEPCLVIELASLIDQ